MPITTAFNHTADLDKGAANVLLRQPLSTLDANAHVFVVEARRGSEPADLTGARCEGWFVRADGVTVPIDGEVDGSTATVTLLPACYAVPGRFALAVKLALGDVIHTILRAEGSIDVSRTDALTEGGTGVQSFEEIVASLDSIFSAAESAGTDAQRAEDAADRAEEAAERAEQIGGTGAEVTKESIENALGYTPADAAAVFELSTEPLFDNFFDSHPIEYGKIVNTDGTVSDTAAALAITDFIPIKPGDKIRMKDFGLYTAGSCRLVVYNSSKAYITHAQTESLPAANYYIQADTKDAAGNWVEFTVVRPSAGGYVRFCTNTAAIGSTPILTINQEIVYTEARGSVMNSHVKVDYNQIINAPQKNCWSILPYEHLNICYSGINRKPINTVEHFTDAAENFGYNVLKCDVRPTSDGELVCCHDAGFTFDNSGYITTYDASNQTQIHDVTAATCLSYTHKTGEHPCLVGDYLQVCRKYGKVAFVTIRNEYMDVVIPKLLDELRKHNMTYATIINCMTYESLVQWRQQDQTVMINYTLNFGVAIDQAQIDKAIGLGYCSLCGFSLSSSAVEPSAACDFAYARANGIRLLEAIAYKEGSPEACYAMGYDGCQIGIPWRPKA